jgi:hypothetical protein
MAIKIEKTVKEWSCYSTQTRIFHMAFNIF